MYMLLGILCVHATRYTVYMLLGILCVHATRDTVCMYILYTFMHEH